MRVVLSTPGKFHTFDLARQMLKRDWLECVFTGYPGFKLKNENIPYSKIRSFPWLQTLYMARGRLGLTNRRFSLELAYRSSLSLAAYAALSLPECDIYMAMSGVGLAGGKRAQWRGSLYLCDRGSSHIRFQYNILQEEYVRQGMRFEEFHPEILRLEEAEYETADAITVPSSFAERSFSEMGVPSKKVRRIPYGVDLSRFYPAGKPDERRFDVVFVGAATLQKGVPYLLEAFSKLTHPGKHLTFVGWISPQLEPMIRRYTLENPITCLGPIPQPRLKEIMSRSHVLVLPSLQEGLALVQAQAMACGCPVIGTTNSGAVDLFQDGREGFIVPIRDIDALIDRMQQIADDPALRERMSQAGLACVKSLGGWDRYGQEMADLFCELTGRSPQ